MYPKMSGRMWHTRPPFRLYEDSKAEIVGGGHVKQQQMFKREYLGKSVSTLCGLFLIVLTIAIGAFLLAKGMLTFTQFDHSVAEFLFSSDWNPSDTEMGYGGRIGAAVVFYLGLYF
ncbi:MAG: hypothetical protein ACLR1D_01860 [Dialister sp.]